MSLKHDILKYLIDKYEKSILSREGSSRDIKIKIDTNNDLFRSYHTRDSFKYRSENDKEIQELEDLNFVDAYFDTYGDFLYLTLNVDNVDEIYRYLKTKNKAIETKEIIDYLNNYNPTSFMADFKSYILDYINKKYTYPKTYFSSLEDLKKLVLIIESILKLDIETMKRDFSVRVLGDSKAFVLYETRVVSIIKAFDKESEDIEREDILKEYNIVSNYTYTLIKNKLKFKLGNTIIDLNEFDYEFSLSNKMIKDISFLNSDIKKVITVENLTTFYQLEEDALIIYLAGFSNKTKIDFLKKLKNTFTSASFYHFSDIDCGGFYIFNHLKHKTDIDFKPYKMGIEELKNNNNNLKDLTQNDIKKLKLMLENDEFSIFHETIKYMLEINKKLEQEVLD